MPKTTRDIYVHYRGNEYLHVTLHFEPQTPVVHSASSNNPAVLDGALRECARIISDALKVLRDEHLGR
jgi:hypothetical protein